eukprot:c18490_g2_i1.p1 GENE.c18490_g2_i1~~c18490_g2_i1.p1  ORF type:complete len:784 (+),score=177.69 c18490_g2_i1:30-2381(+)
MSRVGGDVPREFTPLISKATNEYESLNYERIVNRYFIDDQTRQYRHEKKKIFGYTGKTATRWVLTVITGISTALVAKLLVFTIEEVVELRRQKLNAYQSRSENVGTTSIYIFLAFAAWNLLLAMAACLLVLFHSPQAGGSGIPEVKAYLNGIRIPYFLSFKCFYVKLIGTILSVSSGLIVGPEGPVVHLGAVVGSAVTRGMKNIRFNFFGKRFTGHFRMPLLLHFRNDSDRRDFISIGVAAGFAAAFGAPIGGVLFTIEEASSFWSDKLMWRALTATALACLVLNAVSRREDLSFGLISLRTNTNAVQYDHFSELPLYATIGVVGGLLGALYNGAWKSLSGIRPRSKAGRFIEVCFISLLTSALVYFLSISLGKCKESKEVHDGSKSSQFWTTKHFELQFNCANNEFNELASLLLGIKENVIKEMITHPDEFDMLTFFIAFLVFFPLQFITFGTAVPAGIFVPSILSGCTLGGLFGKLVAHYWFTQVNAGSCALMGAVAMLGGIQRTTISLCVIMMEGTQQTEFLLPIIVTTVVANYIGNYFNEGVYELALHLKKIPFLDHQLHHQFFVFKVQHCMNPLVRAVSLRESVGKIIELLDGTSHAGFPVVIPESRRYIGFVLRAQLVTLIESYQSLSSPASLASDRRGSDLRARLQVPQNSANISLGDDPKKEKEVVSTLRSSLTEQDRSMVLDLEPVMNAGPHMVTPDCPLSRAYMLFCAMGLRHLVVVDHDHQVVGIITRKDLLRVEHVVRNDRLTFEQKSSIISKMQTAVEPETAFPALDMIS